MPCYGPTESELRSEQRSVNKRRYGIEADDGGVARQVACTLAKVLTPAQRTRLPRYARRWITNHECADAARKSAAARIAKKEATRKTALSKLSAAEREALGLKE